MQVDTRALTRFLSNNDVTFFIPPYQRNYEWTTEQCQVFLEDLRTTVKANQEDITAEHFFGTITFFQDHSPFGMPDKVILVDGQQRITSTMLFLAALRDVCGDADIERLIDNKYLTNSEQDEDSAQSLRVKLKQVETDGPAYRKIILRKSLTLTERDTLIYHNYEYFCKELRRLKNIGELEQGGRLLLEKGLSQFRIALLELEPERNIWENPQEIFESMNSLGKPLQFADLIRNYLLMGLDAETQTKYYDTYWLQLERLLPESVSDFLRDYLQLRKVSSVHKATDRNTKQLYREFKEVFADEIRNHREELLKNLVDYAKTYAHILYGNENGCERLERVLKDLRFLKVTTAYSFFLGLLHAYEKAEFSDTDIIEIFDAFRIYILRRRICGLVAGENKVFPQLVSFIPKLQEILDKRSGMFQIFGKLQYNLRLPSNEEVKEVLRTANFYNFQYGKFYLALIEESLTKSRPNLNEGVLQIEHIMPQVLSDAWRSRLGLFEVERHPSVVNHIGNLTLIRHNQELGQMLFEEKKRMYESREGLQIAKTEIINQTEWNSGTIAHRTEWMINYLVCNVLPIPEQGVTAPSPTLTKEWLAKHIGAELTFCEDSTIKASVIEDGKVEFEGKEWSLSGLTREIMERRGKITPSGAYRGVHYWDYLGKRIDTLEDFVYL